MFGLALARWGQGDLDESFTLAIRMAEHQQSLRLLLAPDLSERQSVAFRNQLVPATALAVTLAARRGDAQSIAAAWRLGMIDRGLVERAASKRLAAARASLDPARSHSSQRWRKANAELAEAWLRTDVSKERLAALHDEAESAERALD